MLLLDFDIFFRLIKNLHKGTESLFCFIFRFSKPWISFWKKCDLFQFTWTSWRCRFVGFSNSDSWNETSAWHNGPFLVNPRFLVIHLDKLQHLVLLQFQDAAKCLWHALELGLYIFSSRRRSSGSCFIVPPKVGGPIRCLSAGARRFLMRRVIFVFFSLFCLRAMFEMKAAKSFGFYELREIVSQVCWMEICWNIR